MGLAGLVRAACWPRGEKIDGPTDKVLQPVRVLEALQQFGYQLGGRVSVEPRAGSGLDSGCVLLGHRGSLSKSR